MTVFADYIDLRTAVIEHAGTTEITDVMPRLLRFAEARFNRELRLRQQVKTVGVNFNGGTSPLPDDMALLIGLFDQHGGEYVQQSSAAVQGSFGAWYALEGDNMIAPNISGDLVLKYYAEIPELSTRLLESNWLLEKYPSIYLYGVGFEAAKYIRDAELATITSGLYDQAVMEARADDTSARFSRSRVRVAGPTP